MTNMQPTQAKWEKTGSFSSKIRTEKRDSLSLNLIPEILDRTIKKRNEKDTNRKRKRS